jgi:hypothetical protein
MTLNALPRATVAAIVVAGVTAAVAQTPSAIPPSGMTGSGTIPPHMMMGQGARMMGRDTIGGPGVRMKIMFALVDANGDGALSFEEVTIIHKRIFDRVDVNKDGNVTPEEARSFLQE